jgi:hypothetical protein
LPRQGAIDLRAKLAPGGGQHEAELVVSRMVLYVNEPGCRNADCGEID